MQQFATRAHQPAVGATEDAVLAALVDRVTHGYTPEEFALAQALGYEGYLAYHLNHARIADGEQAAYPSLAMSAAELYQAYAIEPLYAVQQLRLATIKRAVGSKRQLFERSVELWTDHFNIWQLKGICRLLKTVDDREVIRRHALGSFPKMLAASMESPAMLVYLDNVENEAGAPQENYARELMELHTLGVDGGYGEADVKELARVLTGWTVDEELTPDYGTFEFVAEVHDTESKSVLGLDLPAGGGVDEGEAVRDLLAAHPSTAAVVARRLCRWFLAYDPPQWIVDRVAAVYTATDGDLRAMTAETLRREHLEAVAPWTTPKLKRPYTLAIGVLRATGVELGDSVDLVEGLYTMGQRPFSWVPPNGYPDTLGTWGTALLARWEFLSRLFGGQFAETEFKPFDFLDLIGSPTQGDLAAAIDARLTGSRSPQSEVQGVQSFVDSCAGLSGACVRESLALAASMPRFQFH